MHASQWLSLFLYETIRVDEPEVQESLSELLNDNF